MKPITPSKLEEDSKKILPVKNAKLYQKGNIIHQLLQLLPSIEKRKWQNAAEIFVAKPAFSLEEGIQKQIVEQTLNVLNHPILASVFGKGSYAEVPITGIIDEETGRVISGQIDRLIILEDKILVVDFKTNKVPPASKDKIPLAYIKQLEFYKQALAKIYPNKKIEYGLLWTENAHLMML
jgi:ATP-dependent helicase/nuclease subunit A